MASTQPHAVLYPGEKFYDINNVPTLTFYRRGDANRAAIICIPGAAHLARVFYGGHENSDPTDFVNFWANEYGYSFLAISYPLETKPPIMATDQPGFTVSDWGQQAAEVAKQIIQQEGISNHVILLTWSMGAKVLQPFVHAARERSLTVDLFVSLAGTPAIRGVREKPTGLAASMSGYATPASVRIQDYFLEQLREQRVINGGKCIIPDDIYIRDYTGNFPIGLAGYGVRWSTEEGRMIKDDDMGYEIADRFPMAALPYLASIYGDSPTDLRHAVADKYTWGFLMTYQLMGTLTAREKIFLAQNPETGKKVVELIHSAPERLSAVVPGGHHFFLGEKGARQTIELISEFERRRDDLKRELAAETR